MIKAPNDIMKIINCCGYGNTGCTALTDFLYDYKGVSGALRPYQELGFLKCYYSFAGIALSALQNWDHSPRIGEVRRSLLGEEPGGEKPMTESARMHLYLRAQLRHQLGETYKTIVDRSVHLVPEDYFSLEFDVLLPILQRAVGVFVQGIIAEIGPDHFMEDEYDPFESVIGFKNDPPGSMPILAFILGARTSAVLRDPRDTTYDFNRHYGLGHSKDAVVNHCQIYNSQINSARRQIEIFGDRVKPYYTVIEFENLIKSDSYRENYRSLMIGKTERVRHRFNAELSERNIEMWSNLPDDLVAYINDECMTNYLSYKEFLAERGMLLLLDA